MSDSVAGWLQVGLLALLLAAAYRPLGDYMAHILTSRKHLKVEKGIYKLMGVDAEADQTWGTYLRSVLAISAVGVLLLYLILRIQEHLMLALGMPKLQADLAYNTAASFVTNTNWQNYGGEHALGYVAQMTGLAVQNFVSAAVGICVVATLIRGFTRSKTDRLGNFWVDLTRIMLRLLLPFSDRDDRHLHRGRHAAGAVLAPDGRAHDQRRPEPVHRADGVARSPSRSWAPMAAASSTPTPRTRSRTPRLHQLAGDLAAAGHRVLAAADLRQDGRLAQAGLRDRLGDGHDLAPVRWPSRPGSRPITTV